MKCTQIGRLLAHVFDFATGTLNRALQEINAWTCQGQGVDLTLLRQCQASMRAVWLLGHEQLLVFDSLPLLIARLHMPGIRDRCLAQWADKPEAEHHSVSAEFLSPSSTLRRDVEAMQPDGSGMSPQLHAAWTSNVNIPIDDTPGEGPHAVLKRVQANARAATWPFQAATMRLEQDLRDLRTLPQRLDDRIDVQWLWANWKSVLQVRDGQRCKRSRKIRRRLVEQRVYTQEAFADFRLDACAASEYPPVLDGSDDDGACDARAIADVGGKHHAWSGVLLKPYYKAALEGQTGSFFTVPASDGAGHTYSAFQLVQYNTHQLAPKHVCQQSKFGDRLSVLKLETWKERSDTEIDVFETCEPEFVDLADLVAGIADRFTFLRWDEERSDTDGCICLVKPAVVAPTTSLKNKDVPILALIDALQDAGWSMEERLVVHTPDSGEKVAGARCASGKRFYVQCLLALEKIWEMGTKRFVSNGLS